LNNFFAVTLTVPIIFLGVFIVRTKWHKSKLLLWLWWTWSLI